MLSYYDKRQLKIVEFGEQVWHEKLRHKGMNGSLYEDFLIYSLRKDIPELTFFKGQIIGEEKLGKALQSDVIICKKDTPQSEFLSKISDIVSVVEPKDAYGVIELKKWANPKMVSKHGPVSNTYRKFKQMFPNLLYFFVTIRFKDRRNNGVNWDSVKADLLADNKFCFYGNTHKSMNEDVFPWVPAKFDEHKTYLGEYARLVKEIKNLAL